MGYDVTFHPISRNELQRYVLDVVEAPDLAEARAEEEFHRAGITREVEGDQGGLGRSGEGETRARDSGADQGSHKGAT